MPARGLRTIQASSATGKRLSIAGCAQNDETDRVDAQPNAARPPGTRPCSAPVPPVPGQPFSKCRAPATRVIAQARRQDGGPGQPPVSQADKRNDGVPRHRCCRGDNGEHEAANSERHDDRAGRYRRGVRREPLPARGQLSQHGYAERKERRRARSRASRRRIGSARRAAAGGWSGRPRCTGPADRLTTMSALRRQLRGCSARSASSSSANSSP